MARSSAWYLALLFVLVVSIHLAIALSVPYFADGDSFAAAAQIGYIGTTGVPQTTSELVLGKPHLITLPLFYYLVALLSLPFPGLVAYKIWSNIIAALIIPVIYLLAKELTGSDPIALITAGMAGLMPLAIASSLTITSHALALPLFFFCLYGFLRQGQYTAWFIGGLIALSFTAPISELLGLTLVMYLLFANVSGMRIRRREVEMTLFTLLYLIWLGFVVFKRVLLFHGTHLLWSSPISEPVNVLTAITAVGIVPFMLGVYMIRRYSFSLEQRHPVYLIISSVLACVVLLALGLVQVQYGLLYLGVALTLLTGLFLQLLWAFLQRSRFSGHAGGIIALLLMMLVATSAPAAFAFTVSGKQQSSVLVDEQAFAWVRQNTPQDAIIVVPPSQAAALMYLTGRRVVLASSFLFLRDGLQRNEDVQDIYTTPYATNAVYLLNRYGVTHILVTQRAQERYGVADLPYSGNCFRKTVLPGSIVYESHCRIKEGGQ